MADGLSRAVRERLERANWHDRTGKMSCFGQSWTVRTDDIALAELLSELYAPVLHRDQSDAPTAAFSVLMPTDAEPGLVIRDGSSIAYEGASPGAVLSGLVWSINRLVIEELSGHLLLHATAAARDGEVLLLVGRPNSGKTTLLTGLLERGWDYVTDEVVSVDTDLWATGFPKPLTIDRGAWSLLGHLDPRSGGTADRFHSQQWHLGVQRLARVAPVGQIARIAFPRYQGESDTEVEEVSAGAAVAQLVPNVLAPEDAPLQLETVRHLTDVAAAVPASHMTYCKRSEGVDCLRRLTAQ